MTTRQNKFAKRIRLEVIFKLGAVCVKCGCKNIEQLQIDHICGRDYSLGVLSSSARSSRYRREFSEGKLRVLCGKCNRSERKVSENGAFIPTSTESLLLTAEMPF